MSDMDIEGAHLIGRVQTGHALSVHTNDPVVLMNLWAHDIPTPGHFAMLPDQARILAAALVESADEAEQR